ncbi:MAG: PEP-CTERM sorting domain-containing protein [Fimbriimonadaceae bacterium]|nr:PEP-CTERM sorting domain-containing protein [Fimbriimonadaceae bacterium]
MKKIFALIGLTLLVGSANAVTFTLTDGNALVNGDDVDLLYNWFTDGVDDLFNEDYYFRIGQNPEDQVSSLGGAVVTQFAANIANVRFQNAVVAFDITYTLAGGAPGSGTSDILEVVRVQNKTDQALDFHLFEYDDFDLNATAGGDNARLVNSSTIEQWEANTTALVGSVPPFDRWEIAAFPTIFNKLNDGVADNLSNATTPIGPGDLSFAMQWDRTIAARGTFIMSKNKRIEVVPEPATLAALGLGALALFRRRRSG